MKNESMTYCYIMKKSQKFKPKIISCGHIAAIDLQTIM